MNKPINLAALLHRLDEQAYEQLCAEVVRLAEENDHLRADLLRMEEAAEGWRDQALELHDELAETLGGQRGITKSGALVVVPMERCA